MIRKLSSRAWRGMDAASVRGAVLVSSAALVFACSLFMTISVANARESFRSVTSEVKLDNQLCDTAFLSKNFTLWKESYNAGHMRDAEAYWAKMLLGARNCKSCGRLLSRARDSIDLSQEDDKPFDVLRLYTHFHTATIKALGPSHPAVASTARYVAQEYEAEKKFAEALKFRNEELSVREKAFGKQHPYVGASLQDMAQHFIDQRKFAQAEPFIKRSLEVWVALNYQDGIRESTRMYYKVLMSQGKTKQAEELRRGKPI